MIYHRANGNLPDTIPKNEQLKPNNCVVVKRGGTGCAPLFGIWTLQRKYSSTPVKLPVMASQAFAR